MSGTMFQTNREDQFAFPGKGFGHPIRRVNEHETEGVHRAGGPQVVLIEPRRRVWRARKV